ncbi:phosphatases II [Thozetella sp. PMI_491]|nr:phosphatases II [Thozetella sp. PMI_491]
MSSPKQRPVLQPTVSEIEPGLLLGDSKSSYDLPTLEKHNIKAILSLSDVKSLLWNREVNRKIVPQERHMFVECLDSSTQDILQHFAKMSDFIEDQRAAAPDFLPTSSAVLVHCTFGISRSATAVIAYLMRKNREELEVVLARIKEKRKVKPNANFMEQLKIWGDVEYNIWEDAEQKIPKEAYRAYLERRAAALKAKGLTGNEPAFSFSDREMVYDDPDQNAQEESAVVV